MRPKLQTRQKLDFGGFSIMYGISRFCADFHQHHTKIYSAPRHDRSPCWKEYCESSRTTACRRTVIHANKFHPITWPRWPPAAEAQAIPGSACPYRRGTRCLCLRRRRRRCGISSTTGYGSSVRTRSKVRSPDFLPPLLCLPGGK